MLFRRLTLACLGILLTLGLPTMALADANEDFRKAIQAADRGRWQEAVERLRQAIREDPQESDRRVLISGVFSRPYLPHFYLGQALYQLGQNHCEDALTSWRTSKAQGVVRKSKAQLQELEQGLQTCNGLLLPPVLSTATREIERAAALEERMPKELPDPALKADVDSARETLAEARGHFENGRSAALLSDLRRAEVLARTAGQKFTAIEGRVQQAQQRFSEASAEARKVLDQAERAATNFAAQLSQPSKAAAWQQADGQRESDELRSRLRTIQEQLSKARELPRVVTLQTEAEDLLASYRAADVRLQTLLSNRATRLQEAPPPDVEPVASPPASQTTPSPTEARPATTPPPPPIATASSLPQTTLTSSSRETVTEDEFRRLTTDAERLLSRLDRHSQSELVDIQTSRLTLLLREGRDSSTASAALLYERMEASLEALRLLAGAQAYLTGQAQEALLILENHEVRSGPLAAQTHLFLAASQFSLFHKQGAGAASLLQQATAASQQAQEADATLTLDPRVFSPSFQNFFERAVQARGTQGDAVMMNFR